jgi:hypothetical protein
MISISHLKPISLTNGGDPYMQQSMLNFRLFDYPARRYTDWEYVDTRTLNSKYRAPELVWILSNLASTIELARFERIQTTPEPRNGIRTKTFSMSTVRGRSCTVRPAPQTVQFN